MSEIAKILRHQSEKTTAIYAKVDLGHCAPLLILGPEVWHEQIAKISLQLPRSPASAGL